MQRTEAAPATVSDGSRIEKLLEEQVSLLKAQNNHFAQIQQQNMEILRLLTTLLTRELVAQVPVVIPTTASPVVKATPKADRKRTRTSPLKSSTEDQPQMLFEEADHDAAKKQRRQAATVDISPPVTRSGSASKEKDC